MTRRLHHVAVALTLLLPWLLLHARAGAEATLDAVGLLFLVRCAVERRWAWLRRGWVPLGLAWWGWLVVCTALHVAEPGQGGMALAQSVLVGRFLVFVAALEGWVLRSERARRWFLGSLTLATLYVASQTLLQFATGRNLYGAPRGADGELTGPFTKPRDAPSFVRMLFPSLVSQIWLIGRVSAGKLGGGREPVPLLGLRARA